MFRMIIFLMFVLFSGCLGTIYTPVILLLIDLTDGREKLII
jgi:hypothetical protein